MTNDAVILYQNAMKIEMPNRSAFQKDKSLFLKCFSMSLFKISSFPCFLKKDMADSIKKSAQKIMMLEGEAKLNFS